MKWQCRKYHQQAKRENISRGENVADERCVGSINQLAAGANQNKSVALASRCGIKSAAACVKTSRRHHIGMA
jgi:hypothetical protein